jgi:hypothetical protein
MKNLLILLAFIGLFMSCSKSKVTPSANSKIVGRWTINRDTLIDYHDGIVNIINTSASSSPTSTNFVQFNADGSGSEYLNGFTTTFKYTLNASILTINSPAQVIDGISFDAISEKVSIKKLNDVNMIYYTDETSSDSGVTVRDYEITYLTKQ